MSKHYPLHRAGDVVASPSFPKIEEEILQYWKENDTFKKSVGGALGDRGSNEFVFYDGPPLQTDFRTTGTC